MRKLQLGAEPALLTEFFQVLNFFALGHRVLGKTCIKQFFIC